MKASTVTRASGELIWVFHGDFNGVGDPRAGKGCMHAAMHLDPPLRMEDLTVLGVRKGDKAKVDDYEGNSCYGVVKELHGRHLAIVKLDMDTFQGD